MMLMLLLNVQPNIKHHHHIKTKHILYYTYMLGIFSSILSFMFCFHIEREERERLIRKSIMMMLGNYFQRMNDSEFCFFMCSFTPNFPLFFGIKKKSYYYFRILLFCSSIFTDIFIYEIKSR